LIGLGEAVQRTFGAKVSSWRPMAAEKASPVLP